MGCPSLEAAQEQRSGKDSMSEASSSARPRADQSIRTVSVGKGREDAAVKLQLFFKTKAAESKRHELYTAMKDNRPDQILSLLLRGTAMPGVASDRERMLTMLANIEYAQLGAETARAFHEQGIMALHQTLVLAGAARREARRQEQYQQHLVDVMYGFGVRLQLAAAAVLLSIDAVLVRGRDPLTRRATAVQSHLREVLASPEGVSLLHGANINELKVFLSQVHTHMHAYMHA